MHRGIDPVRRSTDYRPGPARLAVVALRQVREDTDFYIPDFIAADPYRSRPQVYAAANDHASDLREAERQLDDALNLTRVLRDSLRGEDDGRAMQAEAVLQIVEKKLRKARNRIDRHDARYLNLFLAYFDLRDGPGRTTDD